MYFTNGTKATTNFPTFAPGFEPQTSEVGGECVTLLSPCPPSVLKTFIIDPPLRLSVSLTLIHTILKLIDPFPQRTPSGSTIITILLTPCSRLSQSAH